MRHRKFRVWDRKRKVIRNVVDIKFFENGDMRINAAEHRGNYEPLLYMQNYNENILCEFDLMEFIGLFDVHQREIFEGDLCQDDYDRLFFVYFSYHFMAWQLVPVNQKAKQSLNNFPANIFNWVYPEMKLEIIGSIYANSDILKNENFDLAGFEEK